MAKLTKVSSIVSASVIARDVLSRARDGFAFAYPDYPPDPIDAARVDYLLWCDPEFSTFVARLTDIMYPSREVAKRPRLRFEHRKPPFTGGGDFLGREPKVLFAQTCSKDYGGVTPRTFDDHLAQTFRRYRTGQPPIDKSPGMEIGSSLLQGFPSVLRRRLTGNGKRATDLGST